MTLRDLLLVLGALPLLAVIALRLAAETGLADAAPPPEALTTSLAAFAVVFVLYVALTLRAIASATRAILERESGERRGPEAARESRAAVSDFAIHIDRSGEVDLRSGTAEDERQDELMDAGEERPAAPPAGRVELLGEVSDLLTRIPSARPR